MTKWISAKNGIITDDTHVLVWLKEPSLGTHIHSARIEDDKPLVIGHHFYYDVGEVTHWQPLLDPPEVSND